MKGDGCTLKTLHEIVPELTSDQVRTLLKDLQAEGLIRVTGRTKGGRWLPVTRKLRTAPKPNSVVTAGYKLLFLLNSKASL